MAVAVESAVSPSATQSPDFQRELARVMPSSRTAASINEIGNAVLVEIAAATRGTSPLIARKLNAGGTKGVVFSCSQTRPADCEPTARSRRPSWLKSAVATPRAPEPAGRSPQASGRTEPSRRPSNKVAVALP